MTHPDTGGGGTSGPGRLMQALMEHMRASRARADKASREASARATSTPPLTDEQRQDNYRRQNGTWAGGRLTPRQQRRAMHKARHAVVRSNG
ncbi:hypothetical protein [Micromonospora fulviviridis]|uniref:hypothetical protein n=1 Tax=Micromonospora fulviviridis TaxID=47860 RepID=UPI003799AC33